MPVPSQLPAGSGQLVSSLGPTTPLWPVSGLGPKGCPICIVPQHCVAMVSVQVAESGEVGLRKSHDSPGSPGDKAPIPSTCLVKW